jgi:membrane-bound serine protease (ClpP class)
MPKGLRPTLLFLAVVFFMSSLLVQPACGEERRAVFDVITVNAIITPPIAEYINQSINESSKAGSEALIILLDTPGGLDLAMRDIAKGLLNAPIPVIVFVYPSGARAASAGVIIIRSASASAAAWIRP